MNIFELILAEDISRQRVSADDTAVRHVLVCGAPGCGKSTWLARFFGAGSAEARRAGGMTFAASALDLAAPPHTVALDCFYARRGSDDQTASRLAYIWELGGGGSLSNLVDLVLTPKTIRRTSVFLFVDLCRPQDFSAVIKPLLEAIRRAADSVDVSGANSTRARLIDHKDAAIIQPLGVPLTIIAAKYDIFQNVDSERKRIMWRLLRYLAYINNASLLTLSNQIDDLLSRTQSVLTHAVFGGSTPPKFTNAIDAHGPVVVGTLSDDAEAIQLVRAISYADASRQWDVALTDAFPQQPAGSRPTANESTEESQQFAEPLIDRLVAEKMRALDVLARRRGATRH